MKQRSTGDLAPIDMAIRNARLPDHRASCQAITTAVE